MTTWLTRIGWIIIIIGGILLATGFITDDPHKKLQSIWFFGGGAMFLGMVGLMKLFL